jgi:L-seryl-tRNA(Ser) seleniumtransferase
MSEVVSLLKCVKMNDLSGIPGVEQLLQKSVIRTLISQFSRPLVTSVIREELDTIRQEVRTGRPLPDEQEIISRIAVSLNKLNDLTTKPVINATGVILHTNLGRAPLGIAAVQAIADCAGGYSSLEYDLANGSRSWRNTHLHELFRRYLNVEDSLVVNNNAAAVMLVLSALARRKNVVIARNQMVEIGGGFRIPEILAQSGAHLMEIGTTNRVNLDDYRAAVESGGALILHVHPSNFKITGFTGEPGLEEIARLAHEKGVPLVDDLGSGALLDTATFGLAHEPTVQESLAAGADIVCFSGDKLLGGPQAGIILGKSCYLEKIKKFPLARIIRADKMLICGLEATILAYLKDQAVLEVPVWKMIAARSTDLRLRVDQWIKEIGAGRAEESQSTVGGGSLPEEILSTWVLSLIVRKPDLLARILRVQSPAVIPRIQEGKVLFDPRTVFFEQDEILVKMIIRSLKEYRQKYEKTT